MTNGSGATAVLPQGSPGPATAAVSRSGLVFAAAFLPVLLLYARTRAPTVTGEDSGELISAAWTLGIAHPPGYPVWILVTKFFQEIFDKLSPASAANLASGFTTAAALGLLAVIGLRLTGSALAALFGAFLVAVGHEIWNHATIAEVYPLNILVLSASLLLFLRWRERPTRLRFFALTFVYGFGIANHPTFQLFLPLFGLAVLAARPRILKEPLSLLAGILGLALPLLTYIQVFVAASGDPYVSWGVEPTIRSVFAHFNREVYGSAPAKTDWSAGKALTQAAAFARFHVEELTLPGWLAGIAGLGLLVRRDRVAGGLLAAIVLLGSFGMLPVLKFDVEREELFTARVFLMPSYLGYGLGLAVAVRWVCGLLPLRCRPAVAVSLLLLPCLAAGIRFEAHDRSRYFWAEDYGHAVLDTLPKDAILFPGGDTSTFPLLYLQACERVRRDVLIADRSGTIEREEALAALPEAARKEYRDAPGSLLTDAVVAFASRPVVMLRRHTMAAGVDVSFEPFGLGFAALKGKPTTQAREALVETQRKLVEGMKFRNFEVPTVEDYTADVIRGHLHQVRAALRFRTGNPPGALDELAKAERAGEGVKETLNNVGALLAENELPELAAVRFRKALDVRADYGIARRNLVITLLRLDRTREVLETAAEGLAFEPGDQLLFDEAVRAAATLGEGAALRRLCEARIEAVPDDPSPHRHLARFALEHDHSPVAARAHYEAAYAKDPKDPETIEALRDVEERLSLPERPELARTDRGSAPGLLDLLSGSAPAGFEFADAEPRRGRRPGARTDAPVSIPGGAEIPALLQTLEGRKAQDPLAGTSFPAGFQPGTRPDAR